jgi:hypothetical protein
MAVLGRDLVTRVSELMSVGDVDALGDLYSADAQVVLYHRIASGRDEIRELLTNSLASHGFYKVLSVDQFQDAGDLIMWDACVETDLGIMETSHIMVLDDDGFIRHHVPRIRGYWGM